MKEEDFTCIICGKRKKVLIKVELDDDEHGLFQRARGVCQSCLHDKDIELVCEGFTKKKIEEQIKSSEDSLNHWKEELNKLKSHK